MLVYTAYTHAHVVYLGLEHSVLDHLCLFIVAVVLYLSVCVHDLVSRTCNYYIAVVVE